MTRERFLQELYTNKNRIDAIDGRNLPEIKVSKIHYNQVIGGELLALFKEECHLSTSYTADPIQIFTKLAQIFPLIQAGSFKEAAYFISQTEPDDYLTPERLRKFAYMLMSADCIDYWDMLTAEQQQLLRTREAEGLQNLAAIGF